LWSGAIATYYLVKSLKSPKVSAWRNAAVALFATRALKPALRAPKGFVSPVSPVSPVSTVSKNAPAVPVVIAEQAATPEAPAV
jgi:hypothetical protein